MLLARLGDPHLALPPVIHVAGTNGKGSVVAFMRSILEAAGLRVHVYTSPHLVRFNERIRLAGEIIGDDTLESTLTECEAANAGDPVTFFEITTAAAFLAFSRTPADVTLLETGLGGRLDATNVVPRPALTVITSISIDHQEFLGDTLEKIAGEKAGIIKTGVPCLVAHQRRKALDVISKAARSLDAPLVHEGRDWSCVKTGAGLDYRGLAERRLPEPGLTGVHQIRNAAQAVCAVERLHGMSIPQSAYANGLTAVDWPARLQRLTRGPLPAALPEGWELWLDGGHNKSAAEILMAQARHWRDRPLHVVVGMLKTKDVSGYLKTLGPRIDTLRAIAIPGESASRTAEEVARAARSWGIESAPAESLDAAVVALAQRPGPPSRILICGSLYLAGAVLRDNG